METCSTPGLRSRLTTVVADLAAIVASIEPGLLSGGHAEELTRLFARTERLAAAGTALAAHRAAQCGAWRTAGDPNPTDWLARTTGTPKAAARAALETAGRVQQQPEVADAWRAGTLSAAQTGHIAAAVAADPDAATHLVQRATTDRLEGLRDRCRQVTAAAGGGPRAEQDALAAIHHRRSLRTWTERDGTGRLDARLTPHALAEFVSALTPFADTVYTEARAAGTRASFDAYRADALIDLARAATTPPLAGEARGSSAAAGGQDADADAAGRKGAGADAAGGEDCTPPRHEASGPRAPGAPGSIEAATGPSSGGERPRHAVRRRPAMVIVRVDYTALTRGHLQAGETCEIDGTGPIPVAMARHYATDAFLAAASFHDDNIHDVVHLGRSVTARQHTALLARDPHCVVPGCHTHTNLEIDHVTPWALTHHTHIDDLARLCRHHHHLKTLQGWQLHGPPGQWKWNPPGAHPPQLDEARRDPAAPPPAIPPPGGLAKTTPPPAALLLERGPREPSLFDDGAPPG